MEIFQKNYFPNNKEIIPNRCRVLSMPFFPQQHRNFSKYGLTDLFGTISTTTRKFFQINCKTKFVEKFAPRFPLLPGSGRGGLPVNLRTRI